MSSSTVAVRHAIVESAASASSLRAQINLIQQAMREVMIDGVHYGTIPGTPKPSLYKPGAEVLCTMFHIGPLYTTEDLSTMDCIRYRVRCLGRHQFTGIDLGEGIGECSSDEAKYRWRAPVCDEEFYAMPVDRRREKWSRGAGGSVYVAKQIRTEPADVANTILKMAAKRAQIAMVLNVLAASDIFSQDLEDLPEGVLDAERAERQRHRTAPSPRRATPRASGRPNVISDAQHRLLRKKMSDAGMDADAFCQRFGIDHVNELPFEAMNDALAFIADPEREAIQRDAERAQAQD